MHTKILIGKLEVRRPLERYRHRWKDNIRLNIREIVWGRCGLDESGTGLGPVADSCEDGNEPSGSIKGGEFLD
jgi:hypothetical protein